MIKFKFSKLLIAQWFEILPQANHKLRFEHGQTNSSLRDLLSFLCKSKITNCLKFSFQSKLFNSKWNPTWMFSMSKKAGPFCLNFLMAPGSILFIRRHKITPSFRTSAKSPEGKGSPTHLFFLNVDTYERRLL